MIEILPLTSLRFLAACYVFIFHMHIRWPLTSNKLLSNLFYEGAIGMSLFFILSGFVLCYRYHDTDYTAPKVLKTYIVHRFSRIYPIYLIIAITTCYWLGIELEGEGIKAIFYYVARLVFIVLVNIFLVQAWMPQLFHYWHDGGSWSISTECFFYSLFPLSLALIKTKSIFIIILIGLVAYIFSSVFGLSYKLFSQTSGSNVFYSIPIFRFPEFIIGLVAAVISLKYKNTRNINYSAIILLAISSIITYLMFFGSSSSGYVVHNFIIIPLVTIIVFSAANCKFGIIHKVLSYKFFVTLGHASYSFYSWQLVILLYLINNYNSVIRFLPLLKNNLLLFAVSFCSLIFISLISYYFIEEPIRRFINRKFCN